MSISSIEYRYDIKLWFTCLTACQRHYPALCQQSAAVVSNLFPEQVKEQLINDSVTIPEQSTKQSWKVKAEEMRESTIPRTIASKYPSVTVMFAGK